jgi:hypothetical protein
VGDCLDRCGEGDARAAPGVQNAGAEGVRQTRPGCLGYRTYWHALPLPSIGILLFEPVTCEPTPRSVCAFCLEASHIEERSGFGTRSAKLGRLTSVACV